MDYEELTPYKKKSKRRPPKKSKHKHEYQPCIVEYPEDWWKKAHERSGKLKPELFYCCPLCGKLSTPPNLMEWYEKTGASSGLFTYTWGVSPNEKLQRELDPATRTLPTYTHPGLPGNCIEV